MCLARDWLSIVVNSKDGDVPRRTVPRFRRGSLERCYAMRNDLRWNGAFVDCTIATGGARCLGNQDGRTPGNLGQNVNGKW